MFCAKCGKELENNARFCIYCGAETPLADKNTQKRRADEKQAERTAGREDGRAHAESPRTERARAESPRTRPAAEPAPQKQPPAPKGGISPTAKILMSVAIACVIGAVIFAVVSLNGKKPAETEPSKASASAETQTGRDSSEEEAQKEPKTEEKSEPALLPHETQPADEDEAAGGANGPALADKIVTALRRPSFFDKVDRTYSAVEPSVPAYSISGGLSNVTNVNEFYLNDQVKAGIEKNGFAVTETNGKEFFSVYERNRYSRLPNFVTVDSIMHVYHLYFSFLLKNTERTYLSSTIGEVSLRMLEKSLEQRSRLMGTEWEDAAERNVLFFAVGAELVGADSSLDGEDARIVDEELEKIYSAQGIGESAIFNAMEDYSQYTPRGYYEGDPQLEAYFRTMMWFGRMNFTQRDEDLDRSALLITMAMDEDVYPLWESVYSITSFFAGVSDDNGYYEYRPVFDAVYGPDATVQDLIGNDSAWKEYHALTEAMPEPQINSIPGADEGEESDKTGQNAGFRFLGQRFSIDAAIFQNLIYSNIRKAPDDSARMLPDALDIPAVLGSDEAYSILVERGNTKYPNYEEKLMELRAGAQAAPEELWSASLSSRWLYTLLPLTAEKGEGWPSFMQSSAWARKDLQTFLGSYAELKHDTVLYAKQAMAEMGGDAIEEKDDRGYVEPEAEVYARLSVLTDATITGLNEYGILDPQDEENLLRLKELSDILCTISEKELRNEPLTNDEYDIIRTYGGQIEHFWKDAYRNESDRVNVFEFPAAIITDVATDPNGSVLEIGTGGVNTIYVAVPVDGQIRIASGSVYSFYQFEQPISERLTDTEWRYRMGIFYSADRPAGEKAAPEDWTDSFTIRADEN